MLAHGNSQWICLLTVHMSCDIDTFTMRIYYEPHQGGNFLMDASMFTEAHGNDEACKGSWGEQEEGFLELYLPLHKGQRERCGTRQYMCDVRTDHLYYLDQQ